MRPRYSSPATAPTRSSAPSNFPSSIFPTPRNAKRPAKPSSKPTGRLRRSFIAASWRSRAKPTGASRSTAQGEPTEWAVEMHRFDENATLDRLADRGIDLPLADALARAVAAAHAQGTGGRRRALARVRSADFIGQNDAAFRAAPDLFPARDAEVLTQKSRAALSRAATAAARARQAGPGTARPRRPAPRQYRADRRQPGAVRCPRVRPADRGRRRALRPRIPAHGPDRARPDGRRQHGAQPLSRRNAARCQTSTPSPHCRCSCRCAPRSAPR